MVKKYRWILGTREKSCFNDDTQILLAGYREHKNNQVFLATDIIQDVLSDISTKFTQDEIDILKNNLLTNRMCDVVNVPKIETKVRPLYYMQTKRRNDNGMKLFFTMRDKEAFGGSATDLVEATGVWYAYSVKQLLNYVTKEECLLPKEEWEPYLTPDRELVEYKQD